MFLLCVEVGNGHIRKLPTFFILLYYFSLCILGSEVVIIKRNDKMAVCGGLHRLGIYSRHVLISFQSISLLCETQMHCYSNGASKYYIKTRSWNIFRVLFERYRISGDLML